MIKKDNKIYADKDYQIQEKICSTSWIESGSEKNFFLPKTSVTLGDKNSLELDELFEKVSLVGLANYINTGSRPNCEAVVDFKKQLVIFVASKPIKSGEEIVYTLNQSCFDNVKVQ